MDERPGHRARVIIKTIDDRLDPFAGFRGDIGAIIDHARNRLGGYPSFIGDHFDGHSFLALAAVHWKILVNNILEQSARLPADRVHLIKYEEMVADPRKTAYECLEFMGLNTECKKLEKHLSTVNIVDANQNTFRIAPWKENVTAKQLRMLNDLLDDELGRLGYV